MISRDAPADDWTRDERYQQLVELAPDAILVHDGTSIVLANAAATRLAGATRRTQLVGLPIEKFLDPPYLKAVQAQLTDSIVSAKLAPAVRDTFRRLDGSEVDVEVRAIGFVDHGIPAAHLVVRDITERLAAEQTARLLTERMYHTERMESVGALAGGVAHEVNNMMGVVLGFSDFLARDARLPEECLADVREIVKAADRAADVSRQLLSFSRRATHKPQALDLGTTVRVSESVVRRLFDEGRKLVLETRPGPEVWVDPNQLEQVIITLALNARDATPAGGTLAITTSETVLSSGAVAADGEPIPSGRYATLTMCDTGTGMDAATRSHLFEPFFTTKPVGHGTGLGLAAVHGILKQHDGFIKVKSALGEGSTFTVLLPVMAGPSVIDVSSVPAAAIASESGNGAIVLVVDDEPSLRLVTARILSRGGYRVLQANGGLDAIELIEHHGPPQLVLTDLVMPGLGGAALAHRLRERWPSLPIVFMSGYSAELLERRGTLVSDGDLIQKPFRPQELLDCVAAVLARSVRPLTPAE